MTATTVVSPADRLRTYASFVRFEHTLFSLPLLLAGVFSQPGPALSWTRWELILVAAVCARTAALALNRLIDRRIDALNPRTRGRELPAGRMSGLEGWGVLAVGSALYVAAAGALGRIYLLLSPLPLVVFAIYPYLKRFTAFCHFGVGLALALAPLAGYLAAHPGMEAPAPALWLGAFAFLWVSGFDVIYATLDEDFDRTHDVHSMVTWLGRRSALRISALLHLLAFGSLAAAQGTLLLGGATPVPIWGWAANALALALVGTLLYLEQRWAEDVDLAFFKVNVVVGFGVLALVSLARLAART